MAYKRHIKEVKYGDTVTCIDSLSDNLTVNKDYEVINVDDDTFQILNNRGLKTSYIKKTTKFILKDFMHKFEVKYIVCELVYGEKDTVEYSSLFDTKTECYEYIEDMEPHADTYNDGYRVFDIKEVFVK